MERELVEQARKGDRDAFSLGNNTFDGRQHLGVASWLRLLETVTFDPASAVDR